MRKIMLHPFQQREENKKQGKVERRPHVNEKSYVAPCFTTGRKVEIKYVVERMP